MTRQRGGELLEINVDGDDTDARRFYERHGYLNSEPGEDQPLLYYYRELGTPRRGSNIGTSRRANPPAGRKKRDQHVGELLGACLGHVVSAVDDSAVQTAGAGWSAGGHGPALLGAGAAGLGAGLAGLGVEAFTFAGAGVADLGAQLADAVSQGGAAGEQ